MNCRFTYHPKVGAIEVAEIEGGADLAYDPATDDWHVASITLDALRMSDGTVDLPMDHPWFADIERHLYDDPDINAEFWRERADAGQPLSTFAEEHRLRSWEVV